MITNYLSGRLQNIFWTFLDKEVQDKLQQPINTDLWKLLQSNFPANIKKTLFSLYQSVAVSEEGKEHLFQIWKKKKEIKNLFLNENDFTALAMKLAIYEHPKSVEIIEEQLTRITNKDRLERFKWLIPSLSKDHSVRDFL